MLPFLSLFLLFFSGDEVSFLRTHPLCTAETIDLRGTSCAYSAVYDEDGVEVLSEDKDPWRLKDGKVDGVVV